MRALGILGNVLLLGFLASCSSNNTTGPVVQTPTGGGGSSGAVTDVTIQNFTFTPANVTVKVGSTVRWTNNDPIAHTTTSDMGVWDSGPLNPSGGTFQMTFSSTGTFPYHCSIHPPSVYPGFVGTITVTQ
ncbi:MAG TPA: plastocyanin/azurin family copper-binding protein [Gemmatimonadales bacterium]|jgi:plastocyanin|nr:plastocyanin/azurin family copper-binding protein [Gemmatimonadales bacterium]